MIVPWDVPRSMDWPAWISAVAALVGIVIAIFTYARQVRIQKVQLKQDLFDKRYRVYEAILKFAQDTLKGDVVPDLDYQQFIGKIEAGTFLFGRDVQEYIQRVQKQAVDVQWGHMSLARHRDLPPGDQSSDRIAELTRTIGQGHKDLRELLGRRVEMFSPDLKIAKEPTFWHAFWPFRRS